MAAKTNPAQREAIFKLLREHPTWSNKDIAAQVPGVRAQTVAMFRTGQRPPQTVPHAAPKTIIDPNPRPTIQLESTPDIGEAEPPPPGAEYQPMPEMDIRPHLNSGTSKLIDQIVPNLAAIATAVALRVAPGHVQPLVPSPQTAEVLIAAPARIVARHSHIQMDEMSEDGRDIAAMMMALGAWAVEIRANYTARAEWLAQQNGAAHGPSSNGAGGTNPPTRPADAGGYGPAAQSAAGWLDVSGAGAMAVQNEGGNGRARNGGGAIEADDATGRRLMGGLYSADADGRRRLGLQ